MRSLLLAALCCVCWAFPSQRFPRRKRSNVLDVQDSATHNMSVSENISKVNNGMDFTGRYIIKHSDIAYKLGRSSSPCPKDICLWPKSLDGYVYIPYSISSDFRLLGRSVITAAISDIADSTCIRFTERTSQNDYINFQPTTGCWSSIGRDGGGQIISLQDPGCMWTGIVTHEILHALGLHHEHVRRDRDQYINVLWDNIIQRAISNFQEVETYNENLTAYDYGSIMHYAKTAFSINGILQTLIAVPDSKVYFGQEFAMSSLDVIKINTLYNCRNKTNNRMTTTEPPTTPTITSPTTASTTKMTATTTTKTRKTATTTTTTPTTTRTTTGSTTRTTARRTTTTKPTTTQITKRLTTTTTPTTKTTTTTTTAVQPLIILSNGCGGNRTSPKGVITSPNFPDNYPNNAYCHWNITINTQFKITFTSFDIEESGYNCLFDKLKIYNGRYFNTMYQIKDLCGQTLPSPITSYENTMQIVFTSDSNVGRKGFRLTYQAV